MLGRRHPRVVHGGTRRLTLRDVLARVHPPARNLRRVARVVRELPRRGELVGPVCGNLVEGRVEPQRREARGCPRGVDQ